MKWINDLFAICSVGCISMSSGLRGELLRYQTECVIMIIKKADDRTCDIETLKNILNIPHISRQKAKRVERELVALRSGLKGEREAAYHIDFHHGDGENYAIIHDLRLEHEGRVAQIDHLILGRMLQGFVCETKYWSDRVSINEEGEFSVHYGQKTIGIPSPIMQNTRHIKVLSSLLASGLINRPKRLGITIPVNLHPITLVSTGVKILRPTGLKREDISEVIKADQLGAYMNKHTEDNLSTLSIGKLVSAASLRKFAESISALHKPIQPDYAAKFGIEPCLLPPQNKTPMSPEKNAAKAIKSTPLTIGQTAKQYYCAICTIPVEIKVARFCWFNKARFNSQIRCRAHQ